MFKVRRVPSLDKLNLKVQINNQGEYVTLPREGILLEIHDTHQFVVKFNDSIYYNSSRAEGVFTIEENMKITNSML